MKNSELKKIGESLRIIREKKKVSKNKLSQRGELSMAQVIKIESGEGYNIKALIRYCNALNLSIKIHS